MLRWPNQIAFFGLCICLIVGSVIAGDGVPFGYAQDNPTAAIRATLLQPTLLNGLPPLTTPTYTPSFTPRPTRTKTPTTTFTASATDTRTSTPTATLSATPSPTATRTNTATPTASATLTITMTQGPSNTPSDTPTGTRTPSLTFTPTSTPSQTDTQTATLTLTTTFTNTPSLTPTQTASYTPTITPSSTLTDTPSITPSLTLTFTPSITLTPEPPFVSTTRLSDTDEDGGFSPLLLIGGGFLTAIAGGYILTYAVRAGALNRYTDGFVLEQCPVCEVGHLSLEERVFRMLGIPRVRRTVRCDNCNSILREVAPCRWRYAVDRVANPEMYAAINNRVLREDQLATLGDDEQEDAPTYIDET